jgi:hypothetical protein
MRRSIQARSGMAIGPIEVLEARRLLATITVTTLDDSGDGSLRSAIAEANSVAGDDTIMFAQGLSGTINLASALPGLSSNIELEGPGADLLTVRRDTGGDYRIFSVTVGSEVTLSGMMISNGRLSSGAEATGGGLRNAGTLNLANCTVSHNTAVDGAGIWNDGTISLSHCEIRGNSTISGNGAGGIAGWQSTITLISTTVGGNVGFGIRIDRGTIRITQSTVSENQGIGVRNFSGRVALINSTISGNLGSGIYSTGVSSQPGFFEVINCTVTNNRSENGAGVHQLINSVGTVSNSVVSGNVPQDVVQGPGGIGGSFNLIGGDPMLGPLADNGGPTLTHALLPGSPAINAGSNAWAVDGQGNPLTTDQRGVGFGRIAGGTVDVGAFEWQASILQREFRFERLPMSLRFVFNVDVSGSLALGDIFVQNLTIQTIVNPTSLSFDPTTRTATFFFDGILTDGNYRALIAAAGVTGANGEPMSQDEVFDFFFLNGDATRDGRVSLDDFNVLAANFGQSNRTFSQGDCTYDGVVNLDDFNILASRFGTALTAPGASGSRPGTAPSLARDENREDLSELLA